MGSDIHSGDVATYAAPKHVEPASDGEKGAHDSSRDTTEEGPAQEQEESERIGMPRTILILTAVSMSICLIGIDADVVATAVPSITADFNSASDVGCFLTFCATQLSWGKVYRILPIKPTFIAAVFVFELGSLIAGVAQNSTTVIVGRAVSGIGSGGIFAGTFIIIALVVRLRWRPIANSATNVMFGIASMTGPVLGGAFTTDLTWRWCFFINLPFGGVALLLIAFSYNVKAANPDALPQMTVREKILAFDWIGLLLFAPSIVCLLLALQWSGSTYPWSNGRIIALLVLFGLGSIAFVISQWKQGEKASIPLRLIGQKDMALLCACAFLISASFITLAYFIPIWFQAILRKSAVDSGISTLPFIAGYIVSALIAGVIISWWGQYVPFMLFGTALLAVGAGLASTMDQYTDISHWAGYIALAGIGAGIAYEQPQIGSQVLFEEEDVPAAVTTVTTFDTLGAAIAVSAAQSHVAATVAYNEAVTEVFYFATALAAVAFICSLGVKWGSVKQGKEDEKVDTMNNSTGPPSSSPIADTSNTGKE